MRRNKECEHKKFRIDGNMCFLTDSSSFMLELKIFCSECDLPFQFLGLPCGLNMEGVTVDVDGLEARLSMVPQGEILSPIEVMGFHLREKN